MTKQVVDIGSVALNGADGNTAREAFTKVNANFTEVYDGLQGQSQSVNNKVDKVVGKSLVDDTEIAKLLTVEANATQNSADAYLLDRANHTGTQAITSVSGLQAELDTKEEKLVQGVGITIDRTNPDAPVISAAGGDGLGDVVGPSNSIDGEIVVFSGTTGKVIGGGLGVLGTAAFTQSSDYATALQGAKADTAIQQDQLDLKVDKVAGYGLSQENYTTAEKSSLNDLSSKSVTILGDYTSGLIFISRNQLVRYLDELYAPSSTTVLPFTTTGTWSGVDDQSFTVFSGGALIKEDLAEDTDPSKGAALLGRGVQIVTSISQLKTLSKTSPSKYAEVLGYYSKGDGGGGLYYLDTLDTTSADNKGTIIVAADGGRWKLSQVSPVTVKQFGAKADGSDDRLAISARLALGGDVLFPAGQYSISLDGAGNGIIPPSNTRLIFDANASIKLLPHNLTSYQVIRIDGVSNVELVGGLLDGNRAENLAVGGEWGHGVYIYGANRVKVSGTRVINCWGDGIYIGANTSSVAGSHSSDIELDGVLCDGNRRQGLSIVSVKRMSVNSSRFMGSNGTAPESGIDIEPNSAGLIEDIILTNIECSQNNGDGLLITKNPVAINNIRISVDGLRALNNGRYGTQMTFTDGLKVDRVFVSGNGAVSAAAGFGIQNCTNVILGGVSCFGHSINASGIGAIELRSINGLVADSLTSSNDTARHALQVADCTNVNINRINVKNVVSSQQAVAINGTSNGVSVSQLMVDGCSRQAFEVAATCSGVVLNGANLNNIGSTAGLPAVVFRSADSIITGVKLRKGTGSPAQGIRNYGNGCLIYGNRIPASQVSDAPISDTGTGGSVISNLVT